MKIYMFIYLHVNHCVNFFVLISPPPPSQCLLTSPEVSLTSFDPLKNFLVNSFIRNYSNFCLYKEY